MQPVALVVVGVHAGRDDVAEAAVDETVVLLTLSPSLLIHLLKVEGGCEE